MKQYEVFPDLFLYCVSREVAITNVTQFKRIIKKMKTQGEWVVEKNRDSTHTPLSTVYLMKSGKGKYSLVSDLDNTLIDLIRISSKKIECKIVDERRNSKSDIDKLRAITKFISGARHIHTPAEFSISMQLIPDLRNACVSFKDGRNLGLGGYELIKNVSGECHPSKTTVEKARKNTKKVCPKKQEAHQSGYKRKNMPDKIKLSSEKTNQEKSDLDLPCTRDLFDESDE